MTLLYTTVLKIEDLNEDFSLSELWGFNHRIQSHRSKLALVHKQALRFNDITYAESVAEQLFYLDKNIRVVESLLVLKEHETFQFSTKFYRVCLN